MKIIELEKVPRDKRGKFNKNRVKLEPHEENTANFLLLFGFTIDVIRPINTPKTSNPDFLINGAIWEAKSPEGKSKNTIERKFHEASNQASNFILDLRRIKRPANLISEELLKEFKKSRRIRHLMVITKDKKLIDYRK